MANNASSTQLSFSNIEGKVKDNTMQMSDGLKFNLMPSSNVVSSLPMAPKPSEGMLLHNDHQLKFKCKYCVKKFASKHALGGHQNAHKVIRFIEKNSKNGMLAVGWANTNHPYLLNRATVNSPYFIRFIPKPLHGYHPRGLGASKPSCHRTLEIEQRSRTMMTNSSIAPTIIMGKWVVDGFNADSTATMPVNLSFTTAPQLLFTTIETGDTAESCGNVGSSDSEKLQIEDEELDLTLKLGY